MGRFIGERKALAAAVLGFYGFMFLILAMAAPPGWGAAFAGMGGIYALAFFGIVAGYFWARWFAIGVGISGLVTAVMSVWQVGLDPIFMFWGGTHGAISLFLWGDTMARGFDGRAEWRERFHLDENSTHRLGKSVIRVGISLPYIILYALAPKDGASEALLIAAFAGLALSGAWALVHMRTWGVFAMGGGAAGLLTTLNPSEALVAYGNNYAVNVFLLGLAGAIVLIAALTPFAAPIAKFLKSEPAD